MLLFDDDQSIVDFRLNFSQLGRRRSFNSVAVMKLFSGVASVRALPASKQKTSHVVSLPGSVAVDKQTHDIMCHMCDVQQGCFTCAHMCTMNTHSTHITHPQVHVNSMHADACTHVFGLPCLIHRWLAASSVRDCCHAMQQCNCTSSCCCVLLSSAWSHFI